MKKYLVAYFIFMTAFLDSSGQAQEKLFIQKFNAYQSQWPKAKLHLIFNQYKYSPGDTAYFKAYFLKEDLTAMAGKQLMELNLVDSLGTSTLSLLFHVNEGIGYNQLIIPDTLSNGIYLITAQNSWMKNFSQDFIFRKEIKIVTDHQLEVNQHHSLKIIAEGGHLVRDIPNRVIINTYRAGSSVQIRNEAGDLIDQRATDKNGVASIIFTPARGGSYYAQVEGESVKHKLPVVEEDGCGIQLATVRPDEPIKLMVAIPPGSGLHQKEIIILVIAQGKIQYSKTISVDANDVSEIHIQHAGFPEGIAHLSLLDVTGHVLASRDFYHAGSHSITAKIQAVKNIFHIREKVTLDISLQDEKAQPLQGEFSIKVLHAELFENQNQNDFKDELMIQSHRHEKIPVDRSDSSWLTRLDNFLISVTEEISWKDILVKDVLKPSFPLTSMIERTGSAYVGETNIPVPDDTQILFYLQRNQWYAQTFASHNGKVAIAIPDIFDDDEFFYLARIVRGDEIKNLTIRWDHESTAWPRSPRWRMTDGTDPYATFSAKKKLIERSFGVYTPMLNDATSKYNRPMTEHANNELVKADVTINIESYVTLPTMAELVKEVIPSVYYRRAGGKEIVRVALPQPMTANSDPVYIIDGVATRNTAFFLSLKPADLRTMKVVFNPGKLLPLGLLGRNGIVMVETKSGNQREPQTDQSKFIKGINRPMDFQAKDHTSDKDPHLPDFRSAIHWNPSVKTDPSGKAIIEFFCSDDVGKYIIRIDGLTSLGRPYSAEQIMEVVAH